jgi:hypothetical protein
VNGAKWLESNHAQGPRLEGCDMIETLMTLAAQDK